MPFELKESLAAIPHGHVIRGSQEISEDADSVSHEGACRRVQGIDAFHAFREHGPRIRPQDPLGADPERVAQPQQLAGRRGPHAPTCRRGR